MMTDNKNGSWGVAIACATIVAVLLFLIFVVVPILAQHP